MAYLKVRPDKLDDTQAQLAADHLVGASPRGWEDVSNVLKSGLRDAQAALRAGPHRRGQRGRVLRRAARDAGRADVLRCWPPSPAPRPRRCCRARWTACTAWSTACWRPPTSRARWRARWRSSSSCPTSAAQPLPVREAQTLAMELLMQKALERGLEAAMLDSPAYQRYAEAAGMKLTGCNAAVAGPRGPARHRPCTAARAPCSAWWSTRRPPAAWRCGCCMPTCPDDAARRTGRGHRRPHARTTAPPSSAAAGPAGRAGGARGAAHRLRHPQRFIALQQLLGDADLQLFNVCADAIVNSTLVAPELAAAAGRLGALERLLDSALAPAERRSGAAGVGRRTPVPRHRRPPATRQRRSLAAFAGRRPGQRQPQRAAPGVAAHGAAVRGVGTRCRGAVARADGPRASRARALAVQMIHDLQPDPEAAAAPEEEAALAREWSERLVRAHAGDGASRCCARCSADLPRSRTPWEQVLRTLLARSLSPLPALSWSRPSRSYSPTRAAAGRTAACPGSPASCPARRVPRLVLVVDVSGSIDDALLAALLARDPGDHAPAGSAGLVLVSATTGCAA
jgi:hypothetical protein